MVIDIAFEIYKPNPKSSKNNLDNFSLELKKQIIIKLESLKDKYLNILREKVIENVYLNYTPKEYQRTYSLVNSLTAELKINGNNLMLNIFFDPAKLTHTSVVTGEKVYIPPLLDEGHFQSGYSTVDYFHNYPATNFISDAIEEIKNDLNAELLNIVKYEIFKLGGKNKY